MMALMVVFTSSSSQPAHAVIIPPDDIFTFDTTDSDNQPIDGFTSSVGDAPTSLIPFGPCPGSPTAPCNSTSTLDTDGDSYWEFTSNSAQWGGGFSYNPPTTIGNSYTFFMKFLIPVNGYSTSRPYTKLVDFKNLQSDNGLYFYKETVSGQTKYSLKLFPSATGSPTKFAPGELMDLAIVRDDLNKMFKVYSRVPSTDPDIPDTFVLEYQRDDTAQDGVAVTSNGGSLLHFFANDKAFLEGAKAGRIYDLRFWHNRALTIDELNAELVPRPKAVITQQVESYIAQSPPLVTPLGALSFNDGTDPATFSEQDRIISYQVANAGDTGCTLSGQPPALTATGPGTCLITASIAETDAFIGTTTTFAITVTKPLPVVEWAPEVTEFEVTEFPFIVTPPPPPPSPSDEDFTFRAEPDSTSNCSVDKETATMTVRQPGTCVVGASTPETDEFAEHTITTTFTFTGAVPREVAQRTPEPESGPELAATGAPAWPLWAGIVGVIGVAAVVVNQVLGPRVRRAP